MSRKRQSSGRDAIFVDTGAWIALAVVRDPYHDRARDTWEDLERRGVLLRTSIPVVLETFTYLDRKGSRDLALRWKESLSQVAMLHVVPCTVPDLEAAWLYFEDRRLHKLSLVDATSFVLMHRYKVHAAFSYDSHFGVAGFAMVG